MFERRPNPRKHGSGRAAALAACLLAIPAPFAHAQQPDYARDLESLHRIVDESYAYVEELGPEWDAWIETLSARARGLRTPGAFLPIVEQALAFLADHHTHLGTNGPDSPPLVPSGTDLWAQWKDEEPVVTAVRIDSPAARAAVPVGGIVRALDGMSVEARIEELTGRGFGELDRRQRDWALRVVLAGRRGKSRELLIEHAGHERAFALEPFTSPGAAAAYVESRRIGELGYVRFLDSLGESDTIAAFDQALEELRTTRGLVLDLRTTPGGGNSTVARGVLGRFVDCEVPYQRHSLPREERGTGMRRAWLELVAPRGPFRYEGSVVVLVGRWTASMGEGLAVAFDALGAPVLGGRMAGLRGAIYDFTLPESGFPLRLPVERLFHVDGEPRERFAGEPVLPGASGGEVLTLALERLEALVSEPGGASGR